MDIFKMDSIMFTLKELICSPRAFSIDDMTILRYMKGHTHEINFIINPTCSSLYMAMATSFGNVKKTATTSIPEIDVKCSTFESVSETFFSFDLALSPATDGIKIEDKDDKKEEGKNNIGSTMPFIIP